CSRFVSIHRKTAARRLLPELHIVPYFSFLFVLNAPAPTEIYTLSLHDALPISGHGSVDRRRMARRATQCGRLGRVRPSRERYGRSEEHTSELQSHLNLVCRLLLEKKKNKHKEKQTQGATRAITRILTIHHDTRV